MEYAIKPLGDNDFEEMKEMFYIVFPPVESGLDFAFQYRIKNLSKGIYLDSGELAGFILCDVYGKDFKSIKINYIVVHPAFQKQGFGSILLENVLKMCKKMKKKVTLVPVMKTHVIEWYKKKGFEITRIAKATDGGKLYEMSLKM